MPFETPSLPYSYDALEPYVSAKTMRVHLALLKNYITKTNALVRGTSFDQTPLDQLVLDAPQDTDLYNQAAQVWNHTFFFHCLKPKGGGRPARGSGFGRALSTFGTHEDFEKLFQQKALELFGSGWIWLAADPKGYIHIWLGEDADNPMRYGHRPLLVLDLWEHGFWSDYPGDKVKYINTFLSKVANWSFAEANYKRAFGA